MENSILAAIKLFMAEKGLRQVDVSRRSAIPQSTLSLILSGERNAEINSIRKICVSFDVNLSDFFFKVAELEKVNENGKIDFKGAFEFIAEQTSGH